MGKSMTPSLVLWGPRSADSPTHELQIGRVRKIKAFKQFWSTPAEHVPPYLETDVSNPQGSSSRTRRDLQAGSESRQRLWAAKSGEQTKSTKP